MGIISLFIRLHHFASRQVHLEDVEHFHRLRCLQELFWLYYQRMLKGITKDVEKLATNPSGLATFALLSTFDFLDGVSDMEQFLSYVPGFYVSSSAKEHFHEATFEDFNSDQLPSKISFFMEHILSFFFDQARFVFQSTRRRRKEEPHHNVLKGNKCEYLPPLIYFQANSPNPGFQDLRLP